MSREDREIDRLFRSQSEHRGRKNYDGSPMAGTVDDHLLHAVEGEEGSRDDEWLGDVDVAEARRSLQSWRDHGRPKFGVF